MLSLFGMFRKDALANPVNHAAELARHGAALRAAEIKDRRDRVTAALRRSNQTIDCRTPGQRATDRLERARWMERRLAERRARRAGA